MCQVAESQSVALTANPTTEAASIPMPASVPSPTAISTKAIAIPVRTGACPRTRINGAAGVPVAKPASCVPM